MRGESIPMPSIPQCFPNNFLLVSMDVVLILVLYLEVIWGNRTLLLG